MLTDSLNLSQFDQKFRSQAKPAAAKPVYADVPDGRYRAQITDLELTLASTGNPMLKFGLRIEEGTHAKRMLWKRRAITANTIRYVKSDLIACGLHLEKLSDLPAHLAALHGVNLEISKTTKNGKPEVYFNRRQVTA